MDDTILVVLAVIIVTSIPVLSFAPIILELLYELKKRMKKE